MENEWHYEIWQKIEDKWWPCYRQTKRSKADYLRKLSQLREEHKDREYELLSVTTKYRVSPS